MTYTFTVIAVGIVAGVLIVGAQFPSEGSTGNPNGETNVQIGESHGTETYREQSVDVNSGFDDSVLAVGGRSYKTADSCIEV